MYLVTVGSIYGPILKELLSEAGIAQVGLLGRATVSEISPLMAEYRGSLEIFNTLLVYNASSEPLNELGDWPEDFAFLLPITSSALERESLSTPFLYFSRDVDDPSSVRGILVVGHSQEAIDGVNYLLANVVSSTRS